MTYVRTDMLNNALSKRAAESDGGLTPWTYQSNVINDVGVSIIVLHHKAHFP
jgi:hypothetical protein